MVKYIEESLFETNFWRVILVQDQANLGRSVSVLKRKCNDLDNLREEEWNEFHPEVVKPFQRVIRKSFGAVNFNWYCYMNNAYQDNNSKPQVHWHVRPRYREEVRIGGMIFVDPNFAQRYDNKRIQNLSPEELKIVAEIIRKNI